MVVGSGTRIEPDSAAGVARLGDDFEAGVIPASWTVVDGSMDGETWFADDGADPRGCANTDPDPPMADGTGCRSGLAQAPGASVLRPPLAAPGKTLAAAWSSHSAI